MIGWNLSWWLSYLPTVGSRTRVNYLQLFLFKNCRQWLVKNCTWSLGFSRSISQPASLTQRRPKTDEIGFSPPKDTEGCAQGMYFVIGSFRETPQLYDFRIQIGNWPIRSRVYYPDILRYKVTGLISPWVFCLNCVSPKYEPWLDQTGLICRRSWFPFRKRSMPFLLVDAIIGNQAFQNGRCHICFSIGLDKVETGFNLLIE